MHNAHQSGLMICAFPYGESLLVEVEVEVEEEEDSIPAERMRGASKESAVTKAERGFTSAISSIRLAADSTLNVLRELNQPDDIALEFGVKFSAKSEGNPGLRS